MLLCHPPGERRFEGRRFYAKSMWTIPTGMQVYVGGLIRRQA